MMRDFECGVFSFSPGTLDKDIKEFCDDSGIVLDAKLRLLFNQIPLPFSIVLDPYYVDKVYRDAYYRYFSSKHYDLSRNCKRVAFFKGNISHNDFYCSEGQARLRNAFIGFSVIRPLNPGIVGRTLLDPKKLKVHDGYFRTTKFTTVLSGVKLDVDGFPFSSQDGEIMTCAEISVWNVLEYYGTRYPEYKTILPGDIIDCLSKSSYERILPSRGLQYTQVSLLLKYFGFSPRIYVRDAGYSLGDFKKLWHYYIESGIPVIAFVRDIKDQRFIHAVVGIGHGKRSLKPVPTQKNGLFYIDSADFYDDYFIMDDNQVPYARGNYKNIVPYKDNSYIHGFVVPFYKRILFEASDASALIYNILTHKEEGIFAALDAYNGEGKYSQSNPLIVRIFLASSRSYKNYQSTNNNSKIAHHYANLPLPKFVWVAELSTYELFNQGKIFGEIIADATAARNTSGEKKLIAVHYPGLWGYRYQLWQRLSGNTRITGYSAQAMISRLVPAGSVSIKAGLSA